MTLSQECAYGPATNHLEEEVRTMKKFGALVGSILIVCLVLSGCGGGSSKSQSQSSGATRPLASITVTTPSSATSVALGATLQFAAQGKFSDGSVADISSQ